MNWPPLKIVENGVKPQPINRDGPIRLFEILRVQRSKAKQESTPSDVLISLRHTMLILSVCNNLNIAIGTERVCLQCFQKPSAMSSVSGIE